LFENRALRRIFGPKMDEIVHGRRKQPNEELRNLYFSTVIIRMTKPRRIKWAWHRARTGEKRNAYRVSVGNS
jgi:hypothetical protein